MAIQIFVSVRFEKTETPARFEPMPSKKHADRMLHVTFGTHKKQSFGSETPERQQQSSLCQAKNRMKRGSERWLLKVSSASDSKRPKHQQDSSPCQAKNTQTECFTSPLEPIKNKASVPKQPNASMSRAHAKQKTVRNVDSERWLRKVSSASDSKRPKHQQDSSPCQAENTQTECFTSPLEPIKNKASVPKHPNASSSRASAKRKTVCNVDSERWPLKVSSASDSKRPKHQQDSSPCQAKNTQTECFTSPLEPIKNKASVPKQPNASMSRAHAKQKTRRKNASCR